MLTLLRVPCLLRRCTAGARHFGGLWPRLSPPFFLKHEGEKRRAVRDPLDVEGGGFFVDAELLNRLLAAKLQAEAAEVAKEGWRWVIAAAELARRFAGEQGRGTSCSASYPILW